MHSTLAFFALLRAAMALRDIRAESYNGGWGREGNQSGGRPKGSNGWTGPDSTISTYSGTGISSSSTYSTLSYSASTLHAYPTGSWPRTAGHVPKPYTHPYEDVPKPQHPYPTGSGSHPKPQVTTNYASTPTSTGIDYITSTTSFPIATTITKLVPCSTQVSSNGQAWYSTSLSTVYSITSYLTTTTVLYPVPTPIVDSQEQQPSQSTRWSGNVCPPQVTVTKTVIDHIVPPSPQPQFPSGPMTTETVTITFGHGQATTLTMSYPVASETQTVHPYPTSSGSTSSSGYSHPSGGYLHPTGSKPRPSGFSSSSSSWSWSIPTGTGSPRPYGQGW